MAQQESVDLSSLDVVQLKALAYDQLAILQRTQQNLNMIEEVLSKKQPQPVEPAVEPAAADSPEADPVS